MAFASRGTLDQAREQLEKAATLSSESADIRADLAQVCLAQGDAERATAAAEEALAIEPDSALAHFTLGRACFVAECSRQARRAGRQETDSSFPLIDGRAPTYLRAQREMETALYAAPPFADAVRASLSFVYLRAGHYHAAAEQLDAQLADLPPGEEAGRTRDRLLCVRHEIARESYWDAQGPDPSEIRRRARLAQASGETKLRLAHACWTAGDRESAVQALVEARTGDYRPRAATLTCDGGEQRVCKDLSDMHLLIAGGLECVVGDSLRFIPFGEIQAITMEEPAPWRTAAILLLSGEEMEAAIPSLYRFSLRSPNDLMQTGRLSQFKYEPGESRYAQVIGSRNWISEDGTIPFVEIQSVVFG
jgi:protein involved in temperature-dependent protein secretion